ncbi:uncharacterized protein LOC120005247 [Tripterygium wilfordii]|uniref:uncharacterized protein LOC120005247 n=1 Tax=Tripterygium wilfordii TaxID=458696 RepID=UPI0018F824F4|nr:uncharacterized protein LOC120005247 [Tripterygium wilfordii]
MENENSRCMNNAVGTNWQIQDESLSSDAICNLRKSMAWDSAFFTSPGVLDPEELFETLNFTEKNSLPLDSSEKENLRTIGGSNARRSLAWDSAFFTSAGVLDQEELSLVNRGFRKCDSHHLPGIKEVCRSPDSNSTIDSDGFSLSSLEIDLFGDLRASMHQAAPKLSHTSSQVRVKPMQPSRRQGIRTRGSDISKEAPLPPRGQTKLDTQTGESNILTSLRPPKAGGRTTSPLTTSTSWPYFCANRLKRETKSKSSAGECMSVSKKPCLEDSPAVTASSTVFPKSPSMVSPTATDNYAVFTSPSPNSNDKAQSNSMRRKVNSRLAVSGSNSRTPLSSARNRSGLLGSSLPNHALSTPMSCPSISSATSRDGWSSESSSSTSAKRKSVDSSARLDTNPCGLPLFNNEGLPNAKPSCLRKPTPKIGFFDEEQYTALDLKEHRKFHPSIRSYRTENRTGNLNGDSSRTRSGKHQLFGSSVRNMKPGSCPSIIRPAHGAVNEFRVLSSRDCLKTHGVGATCEIERKGTIVSRKRNKIGRASEGQVCHRSSKQSSKEPEVAHDSDKENKIPLENQVEDLSRHIRAIDLSKDLGTERKGEEGSSQICPAISKKCLAPPVSSSFSDSLLPR